MVLSSLAACRPTAVVDPSAQKREPESVAATSKPRYARADGSFVLHADPDRGALRVKIAPDPKHPAPRLVELLEEDPSGVWWRVRTLLPREALALGFDRRAGLALLTLEGWVERPQLEPLVSKHASVGNSAVTKAAGGSPPNIPIRFRVRAGAVLRWPDGRPAGEIVEDHGFFAPATLLQHETQRLMCHDTRSGPGLGHVNGWLCVNHGEVSPGELDPNLVVLNAPTGFDSTGTAPAPSGSMDKDIIRRIVRAHIEEVRACYNDGLAKDPDLQGRVAVQFVISGNGSVSSALVTEDSMTDPAVGRCVAAAMTTWQFPKVKGGGNVIVTYPFNFTPE